MKMFKFWVLPLVWMACIFYLSSRTRVVISPILWVQFALFKFLHVIEYGFLTVLLYRALKNTTQISISEQLAMAFIIASWYGMTDEIHQVLVPTREGKLRDVIIDSFGALLTTLIIWKLFPKMPKQLKHWAKKLDLMS